MDQSTRLKAIMSFIFLHVYFSMLIVRLLNSSMSVLIQPNNFVKPPFSVGHFGTLEG